jgi:sensor c-di-GMP phosphodiesterase-like protein
MKMIAAIAAAAEPVAADDPVAEAVALADLSLVAEAEAALTEAEERHSDAAIRAQAADEALAEVRTQMPALVERAVAGEAVEVGDVVQVRNRVRACEAWAAFTGAVARRLGDAVEKAKAELAERRHTAWWPVLQRGVDLRIAASARAADR